MRSKFTSPDESNKQNIHETANMCERYAPALGRSWTKKHARVDMCIPQTQKPFQKPGSPTRKLTHG